MRYTTLLVLIALAAPAVLRAADKPPDACTLLTAAELDAAVGAKTAEGHPNDIVIPSGPSKGKTMTGCMWGIGEVGMVTISVLPSPSPEAREAAMAKFQGAIDRLEAQGWTHEPAVIDGIHCGTSTPPAAQAEKMPVSVGCLGEAKGWALSVAAMVKKSRVPAEKVKALYDDVVKRLP